MLFQIRHANEAEMENGCSQRGVGSTGLEYFDKMLDSARASGSNDGDACDGADGAGQLHVEAVLGAVAVHGCEEDFTGTRFLGFLRPGYGVFSRSIAPAGFLYFEMRAVVGLKNIGAAGIDGNYCSLRAELGGDLRDEGGVG